MNSNNRHLDNIFNLIRRGDKHIMDILSTGFFQSAKDYTESVGVVDYLIKYIADNDMRWCFHQPIKIYVVGDGIDPQTGYLLARRFKRSTVYSIDPRLRKYYFTDGHNYQRKLLSNQVLVADMVENFQPPEELVDLSIIISVHGHGPIEGLHNKLISGSQSIITISLPCCVEASKLPAEPDMTYIDEHILSPRRTIYLWHTKND